MHRTSIEGISNLIVVTKMAMDNKSIHLVMAMVILNHLAVAAIEINIINFISLINFFYTQLNIINLLKFYIYFIII